METKKQHVCPWWMGYLLDNPLRRIMQPAEKVLTPYVSSSMTTLDFGCGFGHFSIGMAKLVGDNGRVIAADLQQKMLNKTMSRAKKTGLDKIISPLLCNGTNVGIQQKIDFALLANSLHETPEPEIILREIFSALKPGGELLLMEPAGHLTSEEFRNEITVAERAGFDIINEPSMKRQLCALMKKPQDIK